MPSFLHQTESCYGRSPSQKQIVSKVFFKTLKKRGTNRQKRKHIQQKSNIYVKTDNFKTALSSVLIEHLLYF